MNDVPMEVGLDTIDDSWVLVPVGGAGKLSTFVSLIGANQLKLGVIMDSSTKDADAVKRLTESGRLDKGSLIQMSEIAGRASADIEDLFDPEFYWSWSIGLMPGRLMALRSLWPTLEPGTASRDVSLAYSPNGESTAANSITIDRRESCYVSSPTLIPQIDDATRRRFEQLAQRVNAIG